MTTSKTQHTALDFPKLIGHSYASNNPAIAPLPVVFLSKISLQHREDVLVQIVQGNGTSWSDSVPKRALGSVPWLRSFPASIHDVCHVANGGCVMIHEDLLHDAKCVISHNVFPRNAPTPQDPREFADIDMNEAFSILCPTNSTTSWFPDTLPSDQRFVPTQPPGPPAGPNKPDFSHSEIPIFITVPITAQQEAYLQELLETGGNTNPEFFTILNTTPDLDDIDFLMQHFLSCAWFPSDFVVVDALTLSSLPTPLPDTTVEELAPPYPSFLLATELLIWHGTVDEKELVARDALGYAVGRRTMEDEEEFLLWSGNVFRSMGLGSWIGWDAMYEGGGDDVDQYYWNCWLDEHGKVDDEVREKGTVKS